MNVRQNMSILFYLRGTKETKETKIPIYIRITVDGLKVELSLGHNVHAKDWESKSKLVKPTDPKWKLINRKITQAKTDIERHFDLCIAKNGIATAEIVKSSYMSPSSGAKSKKEKIANLELSETIDDLISKYLVYSEKSTRAFDGPQPPSPEKRFLLNIEKNKVSEILNETVRKANSIFDNKAWQKTFLLAVDEYLLNFLQLSFSGHRSPNSLEKMIGRKRRYKDFLQFRYKLCDIPLQEMEYSFIEELFKYLLVQYTTCENTAMKYAQWVKEIIDRTVSKGWTQANIFSIFRCTYKDPDHDWLKMDELNNLKEYHFEKEKLNAIRDIFLFSSFTGLSYQEIYTLKSKDIVTGLDGKKWISKNRQKTGGDETLPLLPLPLEILDKYKNHPKCQQKGRLLPVPTNQEYNRCLKEICIITGFDIKLRTHKTRFFFANEVAYNNGVPLKTVSKMLGHKSVKTTEIYVRANKQNISDSMNMVEEKLFDQKGQLKFEPSSNNQNRSNNVQDSNHLAKIVPMKIK